MYWADKLAKEIISSGKYEPYWVDDMKTPSGFSHIGSLRGPVIHSLIYRSLKDAGAKAEFSFVINDFDTIDGLPEDLQGNFEKYLGWPLRLAPSPKKGFSSFGEYFAKDLVDCLKDLGVEAKILSSWDMYHEGKFDEAIKLALDNSEKIQDIYQKVSGSKKREKGWLPFQVICEKCGKLGTTRVYAWDGKLVSYKCEPELVEWAKGCGHEGKVSPFGGTGKLPWKVDWPAHWKVIGVTIEGAGKDHASKGGSYDIAMELCRDVFGIAHPYKLPYEFFLLGGKKMSSSKGIGLKAHDLTKILPSGVARFLFARTDYRQAIDFDLMGTMAVPDLFDEYDRAWMDYNKNEGTDLARIFELSQINKLPKRDSKLFIPRFRDVANYKQLPNIKLLEKLEEIKGSPLGKEEIEIVKEREKYAEIWLAKYAPSESKIKMSEEVPPEARDLSEKQKEYLNKIINLVEGDMDSDGLQVEFYKASQAMKLNAKDAFSAIYLALIGRQYGPKAGWFVRQYPKEKIIKRLKEVSV